MILLPLKSSHQDKSNNSKFIQVQLLDYALILIIIKCL
jgi:hypothetical protein